MWIKYLFSIICLIASASAAPSKVSPLYNLVKSDARLEKLRENKFVAECRKTTETVESLCYALVDMSLLFHNKSLEFTKDNATFKDDGFCDALAASFPEGPANNDSTTNGLKISWFKDILSKDSDACSSSCIYEDKETYEPKVLWMCKFLLNQYTFLNNLNKSSGENTNLVGSEAKSNEDEPVAQLIPAADSVKSPSNETKETAVTKPGTLAAVINEDPKVANATEPQTKPLENSTIAAVEKKSETVKVVPVVPELAAPEDDEAKAAAEVKAEEAAIVADEATKSDDKSKLGESAKNEALPLDNGEINQNPFDAEAEDDPDNHQGEKNEGELPYRDGDDDDDYGGDAMARNNNNIPEGKLPQEAEPTLNDDVPHKKVKIVDFQEDDPDSNFFAYLCGMMFLCVLLYILHQNRQKILALFLEGRRGNRRGLRDRTRSGSKAAYSKLDCNLEEAIMSKKSLSGKSMDIIY